MIDQFVEHISVYVYNSFSTLINSSYSKSNKANGSIATSTVDYDHNINGTVLLRYMTGCSRISRKRVNVVGTKSFRYA